MSHAPTVDESEVAVDALLRELGLEEDLRASCGDAGQDKPCGAGTIVPANAPGMLGAPLQALAAAETRLEPESCELVLRQPGTLCKTSPCGD